ncbi:hypothetical protein [Streptomyces purpureus]|uniref:Secreted protein n=1 Tax=Streptomyces purpureus TaxID=1951 RepID=A0A918HCP5_9ACTN|nr:hypothetical protein [Streptomyces purpureus]GGT53776.1 hypothetical protein GCM10014713_54570 [Streptomyces purpureus]
MVKRRRFQRRAALAALFASTAVLALGTAVSAQASGGSCRQGPTVTDFLGGRFPTSVCPTWITSHVRQDPNGGTASAGVLYAGHNWVVCQRMGGTNPKNGTGVNNYWLYTQADVGFMNNGWGWLPANAVSYGGDWEPIPGVPMCGIGVGGR